MSLRVLSRGCAWATVLLLFLNILTGYGITEFRIVTSLTFGILGKAMSQRLHLYLDIPLMIFLAGHVSTALWIRLGQRQ